MDLIDALARQKSRPEVSKTYTPEQIDLLKSYVRGGGEYGKWAELELQRLEMSTSGGT